jgi:hypothetical protein
MARQSSFLPIVLALLFSFCISRVQSVSFEDLITAEIEKKLEKLCYFPKLEFLCPEDPEPDVSPSVDEGKHLRNRA